MNELQTIQSKISDTSGEIVMYQPDETIRLEVRLGEDTTCAKFAHMGSDGDQEYEYESREFDPIHKGTILW